MSRRCRLLLGIGCWTLSALIAPDTWKSIGSRAPSTVYASASRAARVMDVQLAEKPRGPEMLRPTEH